MFAHALTKLPPHAMTLMTGAMIAGLLLPDLSRFMRPALEPAILLMLTIALVRLNWSALGTYCRRPVLAAIAVIWVLVLSPLLVLGATGLAAAMGVVLPAALVIALVVNAGAPPLTAAISIAQMLGLDAPLTVFITVASMLLLPLTMAPMLLWLLDIEIRIDLAAFYARVCLFILLPFLIAGLVRWRTPADWLDRNARCIDGIQVLVIFTFVLGVMDGALARLLADPATALLYAVSAFSLNAGFNLAGVAAFWWMGRQAAYAMGIASGSRNMALMYAIAGTVLGTDYLFYMAMAQFAICLMPLIGTPIYRRLAQASAAA